MMPHRALPAAVRLVLFVAGAVMFIGCSSPHTTYPVSGTVLLNGEPLADGDIFFRPVDPAFGMDAGKIVNGRFSCGAKAGKKIVMIRASRVVPGEKTPMGGLVRREYIPEQYNDASKLEAEVSKDGANEYEFKLQGKRE
jgi:hypothetical protein